GRDAGWADGRSLKQPQRYAQEEIGDDNRLQLEARAESQRRDSATDRRDPQTLIAPPDRQHEPQEHRNKQRLDDNQGRTAQRVEQPVERYIVKPRVIDPALALRREGKRVLTEFIAAVQPS